jgi:hypothetical protein
MADRNFAGSGRDEGDLDDDLPTPSRSVNSGGPIADDIGGEEADKSALGGNPEPTRVLKQVKVQQRIRTRADSEGAG